MPIDDILAEIDREALSLDDLADLEAVEEYEEEER